MGGVKSEVGAPGVLAEAVRNADGGISQQNIKKQEDDLPSHSESYKSLFCRPDSEEGVESASDESVGEGSRDGESAYNNATVGGELDVSANGTFDRGVHESESSTYVQNPPFYGSGANRASRAGAFSDHRSIFRRPPTMCDLSDLPILPTA